MGYATEVLIKHEMKLLLASKPGAGCFMFIIYSMSFKYDILQPCTRNHILKCIGGAEEDFHEYQETLYV